MEIIKLTSLENPIETNTYLIKNSSGCIMIDAGVPLCDILAKTSKLDAIFITHCHFDHTLYLSEIYNHFKCPIYLSKDAKSGLYNSKINLSVVVNKKISFECNDFIFIKDLSFINISDFKVQCLKTPGHTICGVCYLINDSLFSGDTLFIDGIGRADLPTSNVIKEKESLDRLSKLNFKTIYPGHGDIGTKDEIIYFQEEY